MTATEAREVFNAIIRSIRDADRIANLEVCREYFCNPVFRREMEDFLWKNRK